MYIYIRIHIHMHTHMYIYIYIYYVYIYMYIYIIKIVLMSKTPQGAAAPVAARAAEVVGVLGPGFEHERKACYHQWSKF
jgi:hypothetical protein